jgi:hypothetical protein
MTQSEKHTIEALKLLRGEQSTAILEAIDTLSSIGGAIKFIGKSYTKVGETAVRFQIGKIETTVHGATARDALAQMASIVVMNEHISEECPKTERSVCKCGSPSVMSECPYDADVNGKTTMCSCCKSCRRECAMEI